MDDHTTDGLQKALRPIASLISKSEKAQRKLAPGTWQHSMMRDNVKALRIALALMSHVGDGLPDPTSSELQGSLTVLGAMIERVENTKTKFEPGTSQHSLQRNRLNALQVARCAVETELARRSTAS